jgi:two-component system LytT family response regulator
MSDPLTLLIVDDEPPAREFLRDLLCADATVKVVGEAADGHEAVRLIRDLKPQLVLLDVQMPGLDGFGVVKAVGLDRMPAVVFVTAFDHYALQAFEVHAVDYLVKPFDAARLARAILRIHAQFVEAPTRLRQQLTDLMTTLGRRYAERLAVKSEGRTRLVDVRQVIWIEAACKTVRLHARDVTHEMRTSMSELEHLLDPKQFTRVHRSAFVNIACIREIEPWSQGESVFVMSDSSRVTSGHAYRDNVKRLLVDAGG